MIACILAFKPINAIVINVYIIMLSWVVFAPTPYMYAGTNSGLDYWNGTLHWTGLNYFPFLDKFLYLFLEVYICLTFTIVWLLWIIVVITIVGYCSVFINTSKYILENTVYCKMSEVENFHSFWWNDWQLCETFQA